MSVQHTTRNRWNTWKSQCLYKVPQGPIPGALLTMHIYGTLGTPEILRHVYIGSLMVCDVMTFIQRVVCFYLRTLARG
jgi:exonuclease V gamma subunit